jgi:hypothetical protein
MLSNRINQFTQWFWMLVLLLVLLYPLPALAASIDQDFRFSEQGTTSLDFDQISLRDLGNVVAAGQIAADPESGLMARRWKAGAALTSVLHLGDAPSLGVERFSLEQIAQIVGFDAATSSLASFKLISDQPLSQLIASVPGLGTFPVSQVAPIAALIDDSDSETRSLAQIASQPQFANRMLSQLGKQLQNYRLSDLPNAAITPLHRFPGWQHQTFNAVPGLAQVPLAQMPQPVSNRDPLVAEIAALEWSRLTTQTISGSRQQGRVACPDDQHSISKDCTAIVLTEVDQSNAEAKAEPTKERWVLGSSQAVSGGSGALQFLPASLRDLAPGYEPTGRHPFGTLFKQVLLSIPDSETAVQSLLVFRVCSLDACSPYNQFAVPFFRYQVGDWIVIGADAQTADPSLNPPSLPGSLQTVRSSLCSGQSGGVDVDSLSSAIAAVQIEPVSASASSPYLCQDNRCGRLLGQYQQFSASDSVQTAIGAKPGGTNWLKALSSGKKPQPADLLQYFPPELQRQILIEQTQSLVQLAQTQIDPQTDRPWQDQRLIERVGQLWAGGAAAPVDPSPFVDLNGATLQQIGAAVRLNYEGRGGPTRTRCTAQQPSAAPSLNNQIAATLTRLGQFSTQAGPAGGREAAAWAINQVLIQSQIRPLAEGANYVPALQTALQTKRGSAVEPEQAKSGDILIAAQGNTIGFCLDQGCRQVRFNDSQQHRFGLDLNRRSDLRLHDAVLYRLIQP